MMLEEHGKEALAVYKIEHGARAEMKMGYTHRNGHITEGP